MERKQYVIDELRRINVHFDAQRRPIEQLDYKRLKYLLAVKRAAAQ